jgi:hypothetical protein
MSQPHNAHFVNFDVTSLRVMLLHEPAVDVACKEAICEEMIAREDFDKPSKPIQSETCLAIPRATT